jgi:hypothetical protein
VVYQYSKSTQTNKQKTTTTGGLGEPGLCHNSVPARRFQTNGLRSLVQQLKHTSGSIVEGGQTFFSRRRDWTFYFEGIRCVEFSGLYPDSWCESLIFGIREIQFQYFSIEDTWTVYYYTIPWSLTLSNMDLRISCHHSHHPEMAWTLNQRHDWKIPAYPLHTRAYFLFYDKH